MAETMTMEEQWVPTDKEHDAIIECLELVRGMSDVKNKSYAYLNRRSPITYWDDSMKRWNGYVPPRDDLTQDWQSRIFTNFTRNTAIRYLSNVAMARPKAVFSATNNSGYKDPLRSHILEKMVTFTKNKENADWKFFNAAMECYVKGTVIGYEGFRKQKRKIKEVSEFDPTNGEIKYKEKDILEFNDCYQEIIPCEDFYIANAFEADVQMQPAVMWKQVMPKSVAGDEFRRYKNWKYVKGGNYNFLIEPQPFYDDRYYQTMASKNVTILRLYNKQKDWYRVIVNGILLYDGPIPFHHKKYPFAKGINEPLSINFFWGKSGPDKYAGEQDAMNTSLNMGIDQHYATINKPILTQDPDFIEEYILQPNKMFPVNSVDDYKVMSDLTGPDQSYFNMFNQIKGLAIDAAPAGAPPPPMAKGKTTARQAMMQAEEQRIALSMSLKMLEKFDVDATKLRTANVLQFGMLPDRIEKITGDKDYLKVFRIENTELTDGTYGTSIVKLVKDNKHLPPVGELDHEEEMASQQGQNVEIHAITPDYIREVEFDVQIIGESSLQQSKSMKQSLELEFSDDISKNPNISALINWEEQTRSLMELFDKDPQKFMKAQTPAPNGPQPGQPGQPGQAPGGQPPPGGPQGPPGARPPGPPQQGGGQPPMSAQISGMNQGSTLTGVMGGT